MTFDRPINPPGTTASFTAADVQVFYQDTTFGDASIPLDVLSVTPVASSGVGPGTDPKFGYTEFTIAFNPSPRRPTGDPQRNHNYTGTYSYLITPDDGNGNPIEEPIPAYVYSNVTQPVTVSFSSTDVPLPVPPTSITGQPSPGDDTTTSTLTVAGENNHVITGVTVTLSLTAPTAERQPTDHHPDGPRRPDRDGLRWDSTLPPPLWIGSTSRSMSTAWRAVEVNGTYTLTIFDEAANNTGGSLTAWSVTIASYQSKLVLETGDAMDQNADGTTDENPLNTTQYPDGYTGLTPGDIYAVPTPQPTAAGHVHHGPEHPDALAFQSKHACR